MRLASSSCVRPARVRAWIISRVSQNPIISVPIKPGIHVISRIS